MTEAIKKKHFTETEIEGLEELGKVLRKIHIRLLSERKIKRENGKTIFLEELK